MSEITENIQVVVDDRERPFEVVAELKRSDRVVVQIEHLLVGDYCIDGAVLIERKTAPDFAQSLIDGRLFAQAGGWQTHTCDQRTLLRGQVRNGPDLASRKRRCKEPW